MHKIILTTASAVAIALSLSACASIAGGGDAKGAQDLFAKILTDPACAHDDKISVITGAAGIPASVQASAERHCPGPAAGITVTPANVAAAKAAAEAQASTPNP